MDDKVFYNTTKLNTDVPVEYNAKQKHPGCKKSARPIRSSIANRYVRPKTLISVKAKKLLIKNLFNYLNDIQ